MYLTIILSIYTHNISSISMHAERNIICVIDEVACVVSWSCVHVKRTEIVGVNYLDI